MAKTARDSCVIAAMLAAIGRTISAHISCAARRNPPSCAFVVLELVDGGAARERAKGRQRRRHRRERVGLVHHHHDDELASCAGHETRAGDGSS
jgi:hypothetical protein